MSQISITKNWIINRILELESISDDYKYEQRRLELISKPIGNVIVTLQDAITDAVKIKKGETCKRVANMLDKHIQDIDKNYACTLVRFIVCDPVYSQGRRGFEITITRCCGKYGLAKLMGMEMPSSISLYTSAYEIIKECEKARLSDAAQEKIESVYKYEWEIYSCSGIVKAKTIKEALQKAIDAYYGSVGFANVDMARLDVRVKKIKEEKNSLDNLCECRCGGASSCSCLCPECKWISASEAFLKQEFTRVYRDDIIGGHWVGQTGAIHFILDSATKKRISKGYHRFWMHQGTLWGSLGATEEIVFYNN